MINIRFVQKKVGGCEYLKAYSQEIMEAGAWNVLEENTEKLSLPPPPSLVSLGFYICCEQRIFHINLDERNF